MSLAEFDMRQLLEAGVHFGHQTHRWNPKMAPYIYGSRNNVHIIDLTQTVPLMARALQFLKEVAASGGRVLFVGTKRQASNHVMEAAKRCGQYYVNHRWLGGMMTNWKTISRSIRVLKELDEKLVDEEAGYTKKERLEMMRQREKLERALGGIREMGGLPDVIVVIDVNREDIAVKEATRLNIPVVAVLDTNCDPEGIAFPVPGNDDATRAISLYLNLFSAAVLEGIQEEMSQPSEKETAGKTEEKAEAKKDAAKKDEKPAKGKAEPKKEAAKKTEKKPAAKKETEKEPAKKSKKAAKPKAEPKKEAAKKAPEKPAAKKETKKAPEKKKPKGEAKPAKKATAKKTARATKKAPAKKAAAKKKPEKKAAPKKAPAKKTESKKAATKKTAAKKAAPKKSAAKKSTSKKTKKS